MRFQDMASVGKVLLPVKCRPRAVQKMPDSFVCCGGRRIITVAALRVA